MYKKAFARKLKDNKYLIHLWEDEGYSKVEWDNQAYIECDENEAQYTGLNGEPLKKVINWRSDDSKLHFHDMPPYQKFLVEKYGINDEPSTTHREIFFDIECEMGDALTPEYIKSAPKRITSIAWYDKQIDEWGIVILDDEQQLTRTKAKNKEIIPCKTEEELLAKFLERFKEIDPDILIGYNSDFFDIPYLYYRMCNVLGQEWADQLSPLNQVNAKKNNQYFFKRNQFVDIIGVESLDYMRLHKKYSWKDEPSWKLDAIGEKYAGVNKVDYDGNLDQLFETDINKFIQYNFRDVEILKLLDEKLQYIALTKNLSHKGNHNYSEVYSNSITQDGAISAYLLSNNIIPPPRDPNPKSKKGYAGGFLFCPKAGLYKYMFDEDLTSLYPSIIMSLNIGKETFQGRIIDHDDRNNRLGLIDLKAMDPKRKLLLENNRGVQTHIEAERIINAVESGGYSISANGCIFDTKVESTLSTVLNKWFKERVIYKNKMKESFKMGNKAKGEYYHLMQYTMKILLNSLYGATALPSFRYGMNYSILSEAITLTGHRIIQESALCANRHMNKVIRNEIKLKI